MLGTLLIVLSIIAFVFALLFLCLCVGGLLGVLNFAKKCIVNKLSISHDQIYSAQCEPINDECFICLDAITNEVVATCNHSFCGTPSPIQASALPTTFKAMTTPTSIAQLAERRSWYYFAGSKHSPLSKSRLRNSSVPTTTSSLKNQAYSLPHPDHQGHR